MKQLLPLFSALFTALLSIVLVVGAFAASNAENTLSYTFTPSLTSTKTNLSEIQVEFTGTTDVQNATPFVEIVTPSLTPTLISTSNICPPPENWVSYIIQPGDTLENLSILVNSSIEMLKNGNCLEIESLIPGSVIYLPELPKTATPTPTAIKTNETTCNPPSSWVLYTIQSDDTLFELSIIFGVSVNELQEANCMGNSTLLKTGQQIYVPFLITFTSTFTPTTITFTPTTSISTYTPTKTNTPPVIYTVTPTVTLFWTSTTTLTPTITNTVFIPSPTNTVIPSSTPTPTLTYTPTNTPIPGLTSSVTPTLTPKP